MVEADELSVCTYYCEQAELAQIAAIKELCHGGVSSSTPSALARWRADPIAFIEHVLCDPETGKPFVLSEAERQFLQHAFTLNEDGKLTYPELVFGAIKKVGQNNARRASSCSR